MTEQDTLRGIKGPKSIPSRMPIWALVLGALLLAGAITAVLVMRLRNRRLSEAHPAPVSVVIDEVAEFDRIPSGELIESGDIKRLYTVVSDALRGYITRRYGVSAMELTIGELAAELRVNAVSAADGDRLCSFLERCDLVKFAKFTPPDVEVATLVERAKDLVRCTFPPRVARTEDGAEPDVSMNAGAAGRSAP